MASLSDPVFVFSPQGGQWFGMSQRLVAGERVFRRTLASCDEIVSGLQNWSIRQELERGQETYRLDDCDGLIQVTIAALQIALVELWSSWDVRPAAVVGMSLGEIAAAYCAGALTLEEAMRVACAVGALSNEIDRSGRMAVVGVGRKEIIDTFGCETSEVEIAAELSPSMTVLTGEAKHLESWIERLRSRGATCHWVKIGLAYHGSRLTNAGESFRGALEELEPRPETVPIYASSVGGRRRGVELSGRYWWRMVSRPALFASATDRVLAGGHRYFLEIGPHPLLLPSIEESCRGLGYTGVFLPSMYRDSDPLQIAGQTRHRLAMGSQAPDRTPAAGATGQGI